MKAKVLATAGLAALLASTSGFASVARLAVLGTGPTFVGGDGYTGAATNSAATNVVSGSLWYDDEYNVFYNPSYVNDNKNYVTIQKGLEGGWFSSVGENFAYGIYMNRGGTYAAGAAASPSTGPGLNAITGLSGPGIRNSQAYTGANGGGQANANFSTQRPLEVFFGGDTGVKWGFSFAWAYNRDQSIATSGDKDAELTASYYHVNFGAQFMGLEPFAGLTFMSRVRDTTATRTSSNQNSGELNEANFGFRYKWENWTPYFAFHRYRQNGTPVAGSLQMQTDYKIFGFGVGHDTKVADGVHILKNAGFYLNYAQDDAASTDAGKDFTDYILPLNIALEADATSWLTLRAGAHYDVVADRKHERTAPSTANPAGGRRRSQAGTQNFRIGSTLKFGKLHLDSAIGTGSGNAASTTNATVVDSTNAGFDSQTFALVSATYRW